MNLTDFFIYTNNIKYDFSIKEKSIIVFKYNLIWSILNAKYKRRKLKKLKLNKSELFALNRKYAKEIWINNWLKKLRNKAIKLDKFIIEKEH